MKASRSPRFQLAADCWSMATISARRAARSASEFQDVPPVARAQAARSRAPAPISRPATARRTPLPLLLGGGLGGLARRLGRGLGAGLGRRRRLGGGLAGCALGW